MLLIFLHYQHSFPQLAFPEKPRQQATFTPHPAKGTPECTEVRNLATYLLHDGFTGAYDTAVIVSNDSDLREPVRVVRTVLF